jgi:hypothetical protein
MITRAMDRGAGAGALPGASSAPFRCQWACRTVAAGGLPDGTSSVATSGASSAVAALNVFAGVKPVGMAPVELSASW